MRTWRNKEEISLTWEEFKQEWGYLESTPFPTETTLLAIIKELEYRGMIAASASLEVNEKEKIAIEEYLKQIADEDSPLDELEFELYVINDQCLIGVVA